MWGEKEGIWSMIDQEMNIGSATCFLVMISLDFSFLILNDDTIYLNFVSGGQLIEILKCRWLLAIQKRPKSQIEFDWAALNGRIF